MHVHFPAKTMSMIQLRMDSFYAKYVVALIRELLHHENFPIRQKSCLQFAPDALKAVFVSQAYFSSEVAIISKSSILTENFMSNIGFPVIFFAEHTENLHF